jgi:hypothetical protein
MEGIAMATITVEIEDSKAALLRERAKRFGLLPEQFVNAYIEDIIAQPEPEFDDAMRRVLAKNEELYKRLA